MGPLSGMRVVDCSTMVSGPMVGLVLAEQGADVVKVEAPGAGDVLRLYGTRKNGMSGWFANTNRGKRAIVVDLEHPDGVAVVHRLTAGAHVFVQNFRPGVADRLGVGAEALRAANPELIYLSVSGFGESGPYVGRRAYDPIVQALSGLAGVQADPATGEPSLMRSMMADKLTAMTATQAVTAAYAAKLRGNGGQHVRVNMLDAVIAFLWPDGMMECTLLDDDVTHMPNLMRSYRLVAAADGYLTVGVATDQQFQALWRALGQPEVAFEDRWSTIAKRAPIWAEVVGGYEQVMQGMALAELLDRLEAEDVPHAPVLTGEAVVNDAQVRHNGSVVESEHPVAGRLRQPRHPTQFDGTPTEPVVPAPATGEHTDEVLAEVGYTDAEIADLRAASVVA